VPNDTPAPPVESIWSRGSRTLTQACTETGFSRQYLTQLCDEGVIPWFTHSERGTRILAWGAIVDLLETRHRDHKASACARTQETRP
jgi:hypothetical protein